MTASWRYSGSFLTAGHGGSRTIGLETLIYTASAVLTSYRQAKIQNLSLLPLTSIVRDKTLLERQQLHTSHLELDRRVAAVYKKNFTYVPPSPPTELIESTYYTLDFANRKFVHIGIDPSEQFQVVVHFLTPSRHVKITPDFLKRIFSLMGNMLSFVLEQTLTYKRTLFLETELYKISSMVYGGENVIVIESKTQDGCRVLLNRKHLIQLKYLEWCIFETITQKSIMTQPAVLKQFEMFLNYINVEFTKVDSHRLFSEYLLFVELWSS
ncbi:PREDICTED: uncharacterized protein LOC107171849 [Diuraphis noxia]|uniref:uncharacterized protein LOC107171849 n=1 Tax=Diuraphis noxia TaxID=143948 RepID=UPI0007638345|nr:PREDICTED: uncharacterized protein LOC107171849 [Diuraphis noxia]